MRRLLPFLSLLLACSSSEEPVATPAPLCTAPAAAPPPQRPQPTGACGQGLPTDPLKETPTHTPRWAFEPWISKDISTTDDTYDFVNGFIERKIPVGVVVLDSPWETFYNSLVPNPVRYHDFEKLVADLRARDVRTVLWLTGFINKTSLDLEDTGDTYKGESSNFQEAKDCGFFIEDGRDSFGWWKGLGGHVDFFNPQGTAWWHWQLDKVLDMGVAGFKLDFGDSYVRLDTVKTAKGPVSHQEFSESYYRDFYLHGVEAVGREEFVTMVRPYDKSYDFEGRFFARKEHAPVGWVGDNRRDWVGLSDALDHIFRSAAAGYVVLGSDIGGYLDLNDENLAEKIPASTETFLRWTAVGALTPFMQLHGRANLTPWTIPDRPDETVAAWRYWATLHHELVPFFYSLAEQAYTAGAPPVLRPVGDEASWPDDYRFTLGDALLVAPMLASGDSRQVSLPAGSRYLDWWSPQSDYLEGGQTITSSQPDQSRVPLFVREGAILPMVVDSDTTGHGDAASKGALTVLVYPGPQPSSFIVHPECGDPFAIDASLAGGTATVKVARAPQPTLLRVRGTFSAVTLDGQPLPEAPDSAALAQGQGFRRDAATASTWVRLAAGPGGTVALSP